MIYEFANYSLDVARRELRFDGRSIHVEPQTFDVLQYLVANRERVVSKDDLIAAVWKGRIVCKSTLSSSIAAVRKAVGDSSEAQRFIRTVPRKGFRFVGDVREERATSIESHTSPIASRTPSIAVLPFVNMSGEPEQEYFSDGISEDIMTALSKLRWFLVVARNSSFTYKGKTVHIKKVAEELGVGYVVEGSVRKGGGRVPLRWSAAREIGPRTIHGRSIARRLPFGWRS